MIIEDEIGDFTCSNDYIFQAGWVNPAPQVPAGSCPVTGID